MNFYLHVQQSIVSLPQSEMFIDNAMNPITHAPEERNVPVMFVRPTDVRSAGASRNLLALAFYKLLCLVFAELFNQRLYFFFVPRVRLKFQKSFQLICGFRITAELVVQQSQLPVDFRNRTVFA